jgi:hypothetical protein
MIRLIPVLAAPPLRYNADDGAVKFSVVARNDVTAMRPLTGRSERHLGTGATGMALRR